MQKMKADTKPYTPREKRIVVPIGTQSNVLLKHQHSIRTKGFTGKILHETNRNVDHHEVASVLLRLAKLTYTSRIQAENASTSETKGRCEHVQQ